jgi:hypothetical protein
MSDVIMNLEQFEDRFEDVTNNALDLEHLRDLLATAGKTPEQIDNLLTVQCFAHERGCTHAGLIEDHEVKALRTPFGDILFGCERDIKEGALQHGRRQLHQRERDAQA